MKFRNGHWLYREGTACFSPKHVYEVTAEENAVTLYAPTARVADKGDTLGGVVLTVRITAPMPDMIRVQTWHHLGAVKKGPAFVLDLPDSAFLRKSGCNNHIGLSAFTVQQVPHFSPLSRGRRRAGCLPVGLFLPDKSVFEQVLRGFDWHEVGSYPVAYRCPCTRERVERALTVIEPEELGEIAAEGKDVSVSCQFCDRVYVFTPRELLALRARDRES